MLNSMYLFAEDSNPVSLILMLVLIVIIIAGYWKMFEKAGEPGWAAIVPIYNVIVLCRMAGKPEWWFLLLFIPIVNMIIGIIVTVALAEKFGKGVGFALGMIFLGFIFIPILGFGSAQYQGRSAPQ